MKIVYNRCLKKVGDFIKVGGYSNSSDISESTDLKIIGYALQDEIISFDHKFNNTFWKHKQAIKTQVYLTEAGTIWPSETLDGYID